MPSSRDEEFTEWMTARQGVLFRTAFLVAGDKQTAEDLVQTAAAKLYLVWDRVHARGNVDAYMRRIIINENNSLWRRPWKKREHVTEELPESGYVDQVGDPVEAAGLWSAVQQLPARQRAVIVLRYYEDLSEAEIAETLEISPGTVKSQASRAMATLRTLVGPEFQLEEHS
ncbi:SigE family RNA polymerase sigma factor [Nocardioides sp. Root151]|uniref:SigE family RNA polymerase sigma factor n=1 Tax=Nocardioides sp. Root151 TaxID=1736475 RepID=UPI00070396D6|nr:SigE family RNA polymerase sigma factor [Nocardioides sp. Root151]KQZ76181.1 RNA polymerase subunit sigma-70 [Nocardioides sp. Root151]